VEIQVVVSVGIVAVFAGTVVDVVGVIVLVEFQIVQLLHQLPALLAQRLLQADRKFSCVAV
jgi:hypothetical protein